MIWLRGILVFRHIHEDMEIITYVLSGKLSHTDSMNNRRTLTRGGVQYLSAGTGIWHSEENLTIKAKTASHHLIIEMKKA